MTPKPKPRARKATARRPHAERKIAAKIAGAVAKIPQPHGGALYAGGIPGHSGGTGRPPSAIRQTLRAGYDERIPRLLEMADGQTTLTITERCPNCGYEPPEKKQRILDAFVGPDTALKALDHIGRMGMGVPKGVDVEEIRTKLARTAERLTQDYADVPERMAATLRELSRIWDE